MNSRRRIHKSGYSLVEMMISLVLAFLILGGVMQVFVNSKGTYRLQEELARLQERGRFALEFLKRDIRSAGFFGCLSGVGNLVNNLDPAGTGYSAAEHGYGASLSGTEGGGNAVDSITLRGTGGNAGMDVETPYMTQSSGNIKVTAGNGMVQGEIIIVCDYSGGDIFQVTNSNPGSTGTVVHNTGSAVSPGNSNVSNPGCPGSNAHCLSKVYGAGAQVFAVNVVPWTIGTGSSGESALFRDGMEIVEGVENLQLLYGVDLDGNLTADMYVTATGVPDFEQVVSVRLSLLLYTIEDNLTDGVQTYQYNGTTFTASDRKLRRVFSGTVALRNKVL